MFKFFRLLTDFTVYKIFALAPSSNMAKSLDFFLYNTLKIMALILIIGFVMGIFREIITPAKTRKILSGRRAGIGNLLSAAIGVITPVETFSVVPVFLGFLEAGIPSGVAFTYLITAPMTNEIAFSLFWGLFGYKIAFLYYGLGIITGIAAGIIIGMFKPDKYIRPFIYECEAKIRLDDNKKDFKTILNNAKENSIGFLKNFWIYIAAGVGISAVIHGYVPPDLIAKYAGLRNFYAVPLAVILVIFFYVNIAMVLPIIITFASGHFPIGTILAFTMATTATSIPELLILRGGLRLPLVAIYLTILLSFIIFAGYFLNLIF